ncbi:RrF2 family transcriptional regulator [Hathewaya limosa]|uniref:Rrf2 family protein n=1 Tax=Hathewaya limosa TaxID=1536 RepID=A0ABU0JSH7_HATLI|nr:Rrf2 family transcriptional regulator [Hathewaya limosa]MDQ0480051.1 Rrf2 family protein [Hathewaya limosa]
MKISTKGIYGIKAMVDLAIYSEKDKVTLKSICERQSISERYLEQIFSLLRKGGLIKGVKGAQGGYTLVKGAKEITIGEILRVVEGEIRAVNVEEHNMDNLDKCIAENLWKKLNKTINDFTDEITLEFLAQKYKENQEDIIMYYI